MALNSHCQLSGEALPAGHRFSRQPSRNDAFSFWGLPEQWRATLRARIDASQAAAERYLLEQYLADGCRRPPQGLAAYYMVKSLIPIGLRHRINSMAVRMRRQRDFPNWPCESVLLEFWREWLRESLALLGAADGWHIAFWPNGHTCCIVLTHDVEGPLGMERMEAMAEMEEKHGFRSAFNLPLAQYPIDWKLVERLCERGFEFGAHGLSHDGRLFRSEKDFLELAPKLERLARERGLRGFRAPSTLRRAEWIAALDFDFDSSFADTDPYEPQPGGTCSIFPFHLADMVELPYTLPQDHTLIHLLRRRPLPVWSAKVRWIASMGAMVLALTHPDYCAVQPYLQDYEELLELLSAIPSAWRALPGEVAAWWRRRSQLSLSIEGDHPTISGPDAAGARPRRLSEEPLAK